jgi:hypothetical protein
MAISQSNIFNSFFHLTSSEYIKKVGFCLAEEKGYLEVGAIP